MQPVLVAYDCIITLGDEVELIWQGKWGIASWLFAVNRFVTALNIMLFYVPVTNFEVGATMHTSS